MGTLQSVLIQESDLPQELTAEAAVEAAYASELAETASKLQRGLPTLIECDKDPGAVSVPERAESAARRPICAVSISTAGRARRTVRGHAGRHDRTMISQLREAVRGAVERRVVVLPHLDLLTTSQGGLTSKRASHSAALREPELVWLGSRIPRSRCPRVIDKSVSHRLSLLGIAQSAAHSGHAQGEPEIRPRVQPLALYSTSPESTPSVCAGCCYPRRRGLPGRPAAGVPPASPGTLGGTLEVPTVSLERDVGGLRQGQGAAALRHPRRAGAQGAADQRGQIRMMEELIPRHDLLGAARHR